LKRKFSGPRKAVSHRFFTLEGQDRSQTIPHRICGGKSGIRTAFSQSASYFPCHHSTTDPFIHRWH